MTIKSKFLISSLSLASIFGIGKVSAQNNQTGNIPDSIPKVWTFSENNYSRSITTGTDKDFLDINSLMILPLDQFIAAIQSSNKKINIDSIMSLPQSELKKIADPLCRLPTRIEVDTIIIKDEYDYDYSSNILAFYDRSLNILRLHYFIVPKDANFGPNGNVERIKNTFSALNQGMPFSFAHEKVHTAADKISFDSLFVQYQQILDCGANIRKIAGINRRGR